VLQILSFFTQISSEIGEGVESEKEICMVNTVVPNINNTSMLDGSDEYKLDGNLPHSLDSERAILAIMMLYGEVYKCLNGMLVAAHFYNKENRTIFSCMENLIGLKKPIDILTIKHELDTNHDLDVCGGEAYLYQLKKSEPELENIDQYVQTVKEKAALRQLLLVYNDLSRNVYKHTKCSVREHIDQAEACLLNITESLNQSNSTGNEIGDLMADAYQELQDRYENKNLVRGLPTGFENLDVITGGMQRGSLIVVAGRPFMGKRAFAMQVIQNITMRSDKPHVAAFFSVELTAQQVAIRMLAIEACIDVNNLRTGRFSTKEWRSLAQASDKLAKDKTFIYDIPFISMPELRTKCRLLKRDAGRLDVVLLDYLQLMSGRVGLENREQEVSEILRELKALAKELDVPVIVLSQLNRSLESRANKRPILSDLRGSGEIEQYADMIMFFYRDEVYNKTPSNEGITEIMIAQNRGGTMGQVKLNFLSRYLRFEDFEWDTNIDI